MPLDVLAIKSITAMQPSRLSANHSSSYRTALQAIEEQLFANDEEFAPDHSIDASDQINQFAQLIAQPVATRERAQAAGEAFSSAIASNTIGAIRAFFFNKNIPDFVNLQFATIQKRLSSINLTPASLMATLTILDTPDHPILRGANINQEDCQSMILILSDITNTRGRLSHIIRAAAEYAQNDPYHFISRLVVLMRLQY